MAFAGQSFTVGQVLTAAQMNTIDSNIDTVRTHHKGSSQPAELAAGVIWIDDTSSPWSLKIYDGTGFITAGKIDPTQDKYYPNSINFETIRKTADETINNSDTLQDDDDLSFSVAANEAVHFVLFILVNGNNTADIKIRFTVPTGATLQWIRDRSGVSMNLVNDETTIQTMTVPSTNDVGVWIRGLIVNAGTAGSLTLQWAQNTQDASDLKVIAGSSFHLRRESA